MKAESHSTCGAEPSRLGVGDQPAKGRGPEPLGICLEVGMGTVKVRVHAKKTAGGGARNSCYD